MWPSRPDPWRAPVMVAHIPDTGLHRELEASPAERHAVAEFAGLREILPLHASFDVVPKSGGRVHVTGHVRARVGQICVVTLDPIESEIDEEIDLIFAPDGIERFEDAWARHVEVEGFPVCHLDDIIASKRSANRPRDRESLPRLELFRDYWRRKHQS